MMTVPDLQRYKRDKKKVIVVTAYDALFTRLLEQAGIEVILVGDSLGRRRARQTQYPCRDDGGHAVPH